MAIDEDTKERIRKQVQREFPGSKTLQNLHYYRYSKEIEWQHTSPAEIAEDIKKGSCGKLNIFEGFFRETFKCAPFLRCNPCHTPLSMKAVEQTAVKKQVPKLFY